MYEKPIRLTPEQREEITKLSPLFWDARCLQFLDRLHRDNIEEIHCRRMTLLATHQRIAECAEAGRIAVVESGRDCDCVEYSGVVHECDATIDALRTLTDEIGKWADGPFHLEIERPSEACAIRRESRDLALEAFEDGHPHVVYSRFP